MMEFGFSTFWILTFLMDFPIHIPTSQLQTPITTFGFSSPTQTQPPPSILKLTSPQLKMKSKSPPTKIAPTTIFPPPQSGAPPAVPHPHRPRHPQAPQKEVEKPLYRYDPFHIQEVIQHGRKSMEVQEVRWCGDV